MKVAVIGAGVSGLTAAHLLWPRHHVTVFEAGNHLGGHANTFWVDDAAGPLAVDTGFIVYNERTYPLFTGLLSSLGVATQPSEMSFSVTCRGCALCYSGRSISGLFAQPSNLARPRFLALLADVVRFNHWASSVSLEAIAPEASLGPAVRAQGFGDFFIEHYLLPMTSAIWSSPTALAEQFPLALFLTFFRHHGLLQVRNQPQWRTITGGSRRYVEALVASFRDRIRVGARVVRIERVAGGLEVTWVGGERETFDRVVIATHSDQALALLDRPPGRIRDALAAIPYVANEAILHTDTRMLPSRRAAWAAWNYDMSSCRPGEGALRMTYYMNRLQRLPAARDYCVTLNAAAGIDPARVLARIPYEHPVYVPAGVDARRRLRSASGAMGVHFCGAYMGNGFHEDGVRSAYDVAAEIEVAAQRSA